MGDRGGDAAPSALQFRQLRWEPLIDAMPIGVYTCAADGRLIQYNQQAAELWGRAPDTEAAAPRFCGALAAFDLDGRPLPFSETPMAETLRTGHPVRRRELIIERPDGSRIFVLANVEPIFGEDGALVGGVNCFHDITARKQAEALQARDREMLRAIVEATPECMKVVARDGTVLQMNATGREMVEADEAAIIGASVYDVIAPEDREAWKAQHERVCGGEKGSWTFDIIGRGGTRRNMETHAVPLQLPDGSLVQLAITRDVTRRRQDASRLRESEHRFRELLQALPAAIYTTDLDGRITFFNEASVAFAGRRPAIGEPWSAGWRLLHPDGSPMAVEDSAMAVALRERRAVADQEAIAERPDGTRIAFVPYPTPLTDSAGNVIGAINMLVDITHRKDAERQQKLLIDELNHRVKNTLAAIQSIIGQTARTADDVGQYRKALEARIMAMSRAHDQLSRRRWTDADLGELAGAVLGPYRVKGNVLLSGEPVVVSPRIALLLSMIFHELATNAAKFGALSSEAGKVDLRWTEKVGEEGPSLCLQWVETGGPPVQPSERRGFGSRLLERGVQAELGGRTAMRYRPEGVLCDIEVPLERAG